MATHSSILAWRIPWMEEIGGLQSTGRKELDTTERLHFTSLHHHYLVFQFSSVQSLSHVQPFATLWTAARQASLSITKTQSLLKLKSVESVMPSNHLTLCHPLLLLLQSLPASGSFQMSQFFASGGQSIAASISASVLPMNIQD